jgi:2-polyprenyl-6-methoxyphenol hydroxylase-like FAD-dependent oxidoreductase
VSGQVDAVVVGGGIGGLSSALALTRTGATARVLEQESRFGEVGAGLQLAPNATRILRSWGLLDEVIAAGVRPRRLVLRDAVEGGELTHVVVADLERRYGAPYVVIHRTDLHAILLEACRAAGVDLVTDAAVTDVERGEQHAVAVSAQRRDRGELVLAADGVWSRLRGLLSDDEPVSSHYVAYRGALPVAELDTSGLSMDDVVIHIGPGCHFVQYPLRRGEVFNQVAVFRSARADAGEAEWGTPEELDATYADKCAAIRSALPHLWRDRSWRMFDREPIGNWVDRRLALVGDAAHPMLQYLAQGACQALEDADCLATQVVAHAGDRDAALKAYADARTVRTARVQRNARTWGEFWHCDGLFRETRNAFLRDRDPGDYRYLDWVYAA